ncbi:hypothetical protein PPEP_a0929 [Pseudoalteromonas peptidolytica F12-50-A1]|uniref:Uncharacterized protein n=1 Tax=Pseudoalteromonas peptidolytica F12-50-A1 TaxID=1315280 RepID=A0A8I0MVD1_9GAMM|nr:hypothetical protein [Pseudoalteromonas peptidolytica F12-50-A1]
MTLTYSHLIFTADGLIFIKKLTQPHLCPTAPLESKKVAV